MHILEHKCFGTLKMIILKHKWHPEHRKCLPRSAGIWLLWQRRTLSRKTLSLDSHPLHARGCGLIGLFNKMLTPWYSSSSNASSFSCASWNARALLHHNPYWRAKKIKFLLSFAMKSTGIGVQEVHGSEATFTSSLPAASIVFHIFSSFTENPNEAGVVTMIKKLGSPRESFQPEVIVAGRALRVLYSCPSCSNVSFVHWNIHNHNLGRAEADYLAGRLRNDVRSAHADPSGFIVIVSGDFNFLPPGKFRRSISNPNSSRTAAPTAPNPGKLSHFSAYPQPAYRYCERLEH